MCPEKDDATADPGSFHSFWYDDGRKGNFLVRKKIKENSEKVPYLGYCFWKINDNCDTPALFVHIHVNGTMKA